MADHATTAVLDSWVRRFAVLVSENRNYLTELDAAIGDADHGSNLDRGMTAAVAALDDLGPTTAGPLFSKVGMTLVSTVGGASGPLFGTLFLRMGTSLGDGDSVDAGQVAAALRAGLDGVEARGKAQPGDKTMYDALSPAVDALDKAVAEGADLTDGLGRARDAAAEGRDATTPMLARKGRASYLGEPSVALLLQAATDTVA